MRHQSTPAQNNTKVASCGAKCKNNQTKNRLQVKLHHGAVKNTRFSSLTLYSTDSSNYTAPPKKISTLTYFGLVAEALSPNSLVNPVFVGFESLLVFPLVAFGVFCWAACFACSLGDELDFSTEEGRSASAGHELGFGFGFASGGGDLVKKLKRELCFAMPADSYRLRAVVLLVKVCSRVAGLPLHHLAAS